MASWIDMSRIAIFPTLASEEIEARAMRARAVAYADLRKERGHALPRGGAHPQPFISRTCATSIAQAHHHLHEGGAV
jgi:hypothetical protein